MTRRVRSRKNKTQQGRVATLGVELLRTLDEWSKIVNDWDGTCAYCGKKPLKGVKHTRDHVVPISAGGSEGLENVVPACKPCNEKKGSQFWEPLVRPSQRVPEKVIHFARRYGGGKAKVEPVASPKRPRPRGKIVGAGLRTMQDALQGAMRGEER